MRPVLEQNDKGKSENNEKNEPEETTQKCHDQTE
jgi:hypothetical protein